MPRPGHDTSQQTMLVGQCPGGRAVPQAWHVHNWERVVQHVRAGLGTAHLPGLCIIWCFRPWHKKNKDQEGNNKVCIPTCYIKLQRCRRTNSKWGLFCFYKIIISVIHILIIIYERGNSSTKLQILKNSSYHFVIYMNMLHSLIDSLIKLSDLK